MIPHGVDRRRFLRMATVGALAGMNLPNQPRAEAGEPPPQVLIIGGGMAGVAAAFWLRAFGISAVILEAQGRLGGRINTSHRWANAPLDMGAAYLHDWPHSPITIFANAFRIQTVEADFTPKMFGLNNQPLGIDQLAQIGFDYAYLRAQVDWYRRFLQFYRIPDQPLGNVLTPILNSYNLPAETYAGVQTLVDAEIRARFGVELSELSLYNFDQDQNVIEEHDLIFPKGYTQVIDGLWIGSQQPAVLNCQVQQLIYNGPYGVTAVTNQGSFSAKYAIVTLPIGILQRCLGSNPLVQFVPQLPVWKAVALGGLAMGAWDKLAMLFPSNFWGATQLLKNTQPTGNYNLWLNVASAINQPVLIGAVFGAQARAIESLSDTQALAGIMSQLIPWYQAQGIQVPNPTDFQRSAWGINPYCYGVYPHIVPGGSGINYDLMSLPVSYGPTPRLLFAGDGTDRVHCGSTWGAYMSGYREAIRAWTLLNPRKNVMSLAERRLPVPMTGRFQPAQVWQQSQASLKAAHGFVERSSRKR